MLATLCLALEEQRLADDRRYGGRVIGLGNQERRFGPLTGEETLGIGGDEDHWHFECRQHVVDGVEPRSPVRQLDVGENKTWLLHLGESERFAAGVRRADHAMAEAF